MPKVETKKKKIGDLEVSCTQFGAFEQAELGDRITILLAPAGGKLAGLTGLADVSELGPIFEAIMKTITTDVASRLRLDLVANTQVKVGDRWLSLVGKDEVNLAFGGDLKAFWQTVAFAVEVNFGPLFGGVRGAISGILAAKEPPPATAETST